MTKITEAPVESAAALRIWLRDFVYEARGALSEQLLPVVRWLAEKERLRCILEAVCADSELVQRAGAQSYIHINGFDKLVLLSEPDVFKLRLHIWWGDNAALSKETIHNHRSDFAACVVTGAYRAEEFERADEGAPFREHRYYSPEADGQFGYEECGSARLRTASDRLMVAGTGYFLDHEVLHRISQDMPTLTASLVLQGSTMKRYTNSLLDRPVRIDGHAMPSPRRLSGAEVADRCGRLLNRLDGKNDAPERAPQTRMSLARDVLRGYTGEYRYEGSHPFALEIEAVEEHLRVCADLLPRPFDLYPSSPVDFFFDNIDVRLHFVMGEGGAVQGVNVRFPSFESFAKRVG